MSILTDGEEVHEWRVTGEPGKGYPSYEFTFRSNDPRWGDSEARARWFVAIADDSWDEGPYLHHRTVTYTAWEEA